MAQDKEIQELFDNVVHIGHRTQKWNPRMKKFIHGERNGIHILDLEKTARYLEDAVSFMSDLSKNGKKILFVSTKPQSVNVVRETAEACGMPFVVSKWIPGLLTNFKTIRARIKYLANLKEDEATGEFEKYTKKEVQKLKKEMMKLQTALGGVEHIESLPDAVFVIDVVRDKIVVEEANKVGIPVIAFLDTNADPLKVDYPIPANDDAIKSLTFLLNKISASVKKPAKTQK